MRGVVAFFARCTTSHAVEVSVHSKQQLGIPVAITHHLPLSHSNTATAWLMDPQSPSHSSWGKEGREKGVCFPQSLKHAQGHSGAPVAQEGKNSRSRDGWCCEQAASLFSLSQVKLNTHKRKMKAFNPETFTCRLHWLRCCGGSGGKGAKYGFCKPTSLLLKNCLWSSLTTDLRVQRGQ